MSMKLLWFLPLIFLVLLLSTGMNLHAQAFKGYGVGGFNLTQVDGDECFGYKKIGLNLGVGVLIPYKKKWAISLENTFNQKGAWQPALYSDSASGEYRLLLNYVEVPLMIHFEDKETMTFGAGFSWSRLVEVKEYEHGNRVETTTLKGPYDRSDWTFIGDIRFRIYKKLKFNFRYNYSINKIRTRTFVTSQQTWTRKQYNNVLSFRLIYMFNERQPVSKKKSE